MIKIHLIQYYIFYNQLTLCLIIIKKIFIRVNKQVAAQLLSSRVFRCQSPLII